MATLSRWKPNPDLQKLSTGCGAAAHREFGGMACPLRMAMQGEAHLPED
jgi:hypothetical protein